MGHIPHLSNIVLIRKPVKFYQTQSNTIQSNNTYVEVFLGLNSEIKLKIF